MVNKTPQVVTIAGSDSGGGAGIQADLKTFQARKAFGMSIVVALTAQNTLGVQESLPVPIDFIDAQFDSLAADFNIAAVKTGMLFNGAYVENVVNNLKQVDFGPLIVDPVMVAKGGHQLLDQDAIDAIQQKLLPIATLVTPNIPEAEIIAGISIESEADMLEAGVKLQGFGAKNVIVKGGHSKAARARDLVLFENGDTMWLSSPRIDTENTHGTGDTLSAAIAAELAKGTALKEAIIIGKQFIQGAIKDGIDVGHGHGPTNHWAELSDDIVVENE
ncbi:bifunctional hydroxymethylpyrimidine kinase/phosphomethylpyrimidine kinase [Aerococcaceae bacterium 50-4]